jgi:hypothetical protein
MAAPVAAGRNSPPPSVAAARPSTGGARGKGLEQGNGGGPRLKMTSTLVSPAGAGGGQIQREAKPARRPEQPGRRAHVAGVSVGGRGVVPVSMARRAEAQFRVYRRGVGSDTRPDSLLLAWDLSTVSSPIPSWSHSAGGRGH